MIRISFGSTALLVERNTNYIDLIDIGRRPKWIFLSSVFRLPSTDELHLIYYQNIVLSTKLVVVSIILCLVVNHKGFLDV